MVVGGNQAGKGAKGLLMGKGSDQGDQKDKKKPISRSSRAGLQVLLFLPFSSSSYDIFLISSPALFLFLCHPHAIRNTTHKLQKHASSGFNFCFSRKCN
jgi:hypothetical protein